MISREFLEIYGRKTNQLFEKPLIEEICYICGQKRDNNNDMCRNYSIETSFGINLYFHSDCYLWHQHILQQIRKRKMRRSLK